MPSTWSISPPGHTPPLFNPDATGPIDIGGMQLASSHDGALLNDVSDALFKGDAADFGKATTLFNDLLGINPPSAAAASSAHDAAVSAWDAAANNAPTSSNPAAVLYLSGIIDGAVEAGLSQGIAQRAVDELPGAEAAISAYDGSLSTQVDQLFFEPLNQDWEHTSEALLHADQAYEAAVTSGSGLDAADSSLFTADLQALGDAFDVRYVRRRSVRDTIEAWMPPPPPPKRELGGGATTCRRGRPGCSTGPGSDRGPQWSGPAPPASRQTLGPSPGLARSGFPARR